MNSGAVAQQRKRHSVPEAAYYRKREAGREAVEDPLRLT